MSSTRNVLKVFENIEMEEGVGSRVRRSIGTSGLRLVLLFSFGCLAYVVVETFIHSSCSIILESQKVQAFLTILIEVRLP